MKGRRRLLAVEQKLDTNVLIPIFIPSQKYSTESLSHEDE